MKNSEGKAGRLQQELQSLQSTLLNNVQEHRDSEGELRKVTKCKFKLGISTYSFTIICFTLVYFVWTFAH